jgi:trimeric autotransporter adhesin
MRIMQHLRNSFLRSEIITHLTIPSVRTSTNRSPLRLGFFLIPLVLGCFALSQTAPAQCQDGCDLSNANTFLGFEALFSNTTGARNTAIGDIALFANTTGGSNTATGAAALGGNTTGGNNTANGAFALSNNTTGNNNTATGLFALDSNNADNNTATGFQALFSNTTGTFNTASGSNALQLNQTGSNNTATGGGALLNNTDGFENTATGVDALVSNTSGGDNTANGLFALFHNTTGGNNTADGNNALLNNTTGSNNIALGNAAGINLTTGKNNIDIGNAGVAGEVNKIRIGTTGIQRATFIAGISGVTVPAGVGVIIGTDGKLGTVVSSARFKNAVKPMDKASEAILALKPVTFRYKPDLDPDGIPQFGLVAEDVEKVNPYLVARDEQGKPYTVRYEAVNAMLLNEFLKEHKAFLQEQHKVEKLEITVEQQRKDFEATVAELRGQIQKVSAQLELSKSAPRTVLNSQ